MMNFTIKKPINYLFIIYFLSSIQSVFSQCPTVVWADEFSGTSLDVTKWNYQVGDGCAEGICGWGNAELQSYQQSNVTVSNGTLKITAKKERIRGSKYTSGRINSKAKGDFTYGRFEASIKLPLGDGLWPAFWMLSTNEIYGGWPQSGEIDIMEFVASDPSRILGYMHYGDLYPNNQSQGNTYTLQNGVFPDAFHEFAIEWEPGEIRWFMDGTLYSVKKTSDVDPFFWPFDQDFHFLLNVAVGGNLGGAVNENMLPATMEVDYVRVYDGFKPFVNGERVVVNQAQGVTYSLANIPPNTNVSWSVPQGATIVSGQGTSSIVVDFGAESGAISASFNDGCGTQLLNLYVEVELPYVKDVSFENFDEPSTATFSSATGILTEVGNPAPNAINGSALSGKYDRNAAEQYDVLVYGVNNIIDASQYVIKEKKFYMDVHTSAPVGTEIILQLETSVATPSNYPSGRHSRYVATVEDTNTWQRLAFSLLDRPDGTASSTDVGTMILLFASNSFTSDTYYFDNLDSYNADNGGGSNQAPVVSITGPTDGAMLSQGQTISITANASDADGSIVQVEFYVNGNSIGVDTTQPYSVNWQVVAGNSTITADATDNELATTTSQSVGVTGESSGDPVNVHVASIATGTVDMGKGNKSGTATVIILDDQGSAILNASVTGTFSGTFNEQKSAVTDSNGVAVLQTQASSKGGVVVNLCVDDVVYTSLPYDPTENIVTCSGTSAKTATTSTRLGEDDISVVQDTNINFMIYPNPAKDVVRVAFGELKNSKVAQIYNLSGKVLMTKQMNGAEGEMDISSLPKGLYIIKITDSSNTIKTIRLVK
ncbi:family 16 glycosylhydrolase [Flavobacteriaceae bacterium KMM 6898]|nr:family 16 glycosylhydrolase [Flavobacteriaceae bacterium KMM 6898]